MCSLFNVPDIQNNLPFDPMITIYICLLLFYLIRPVIVFAILPFLFDHNNNNNKFILSPKIPRSSVDHLLGLNVFYSGIK